MAIHGMAHIYNIALDDNDFCVIGPQGLNYKGKVACEWHIVPKGNFASPNVDVTLGAIFKHGLRHDYYAISMKFNDDEKRNVIGINSIVETHIPE